MNCGLIKCNRKIPLSFQCECRCKKIFCIYHKYPEDHNCTFNYKLDQQQKLTKENPKVISNKITKI